jgi:hypothetical protein
MIQTQILLFPYGSTKNKTLLEGLKSKGTSSSLSRIYSKIYLNYKATFQNKNAKF